MNQQTPHSSLSHARARHALLAAMFAVAGTTSAFAASATWQGTATDANWSTVTNWSTGAAPGSTTGNSTDTATFNAALSGGTIGGSANPIVIPAGQRIGSIVFDTASVGAYQIGSNAGEILRVGSNSAASAAGISITATAANSQVIAAPLQLSAYVSSTNIQYAFNNNATDSNVTLSFTGAITGNISASRPAKLILAGSNTGNNIISGNLSTPSFGQIVPVLTKNGAGTWILAGSNTFSGSAVTSANNTAGIQINAGVLVAQNSNALGSTTGSINNYINNGGTLELNANGTAGSINLNNALTLQLQNGGTIRSAGSNQVSSVINVATGAGVSSTLAAVGASDVFTIGNAANDLTGGAADSVINISGSGTVLLGQASNYAGAWAVNSGTLSLGNSAALGSAGGVTINGGNLASSVSDVAGGAITFSSGALDLNSTSVGSLSLGTDKTFSMSGGTWSVSIGGTSSYDQIIGNGTGSSFTITGGTVALTGISDYSVGYTLFSGFASGSATGLTISGYDTVNWLASLGDNGILSFAPTAVPEPSTFALLAGFAAVGGTALRRRRRA